MRQVPAFSSFLIVGRGRVARHFSHFFELEGLSFKTWNRSQSVAELKSLAKEASHVLLLISDRAIVPFADEHAEILKGRQLVHFSGSLVAEGIAGCHPLMTFAGDLYDLETYRRVPFVFDSSYGSLQELLPGLLSNASYPIDARLKGRYHAMCVLAGNFTVLLWEKAFRDFHDRLGLPGEALLPYMNQVMQNLSLSASEGSVLTGPLARGDQETLAKNLADLRLDPYREVYSAFVNAFFAEHVVMPARPRAVKGAQQ